MKFMVEVAISHEGDKVVLSVTLTQEQASRIAATIEDEISQARGIDPRSGEPL